MLNIKKIITIMAVSTSLGLSGEIIGNFNSHLSVAKASNYTLPKSYWGNYVVIEEYDDIKNDKPSKSGIDIKVTIKPNSVIIKDFHSKYTIRAFVIKKYSKKNSYYFEAKHGSDPLYISKKNGKIHVSINTGGYILKKK